jgi:hypothetical protein
VPGASFQPRLWVFSVVGADSLAPGTKRRSDHDVLSTRGVDLRGKIFQSTVQNVQGNTSGLGTLGI